MSAGRLRSQPSLGKEGMAQPFRRVKMPFCRACQINLMLWANQTIRRSAQVKMVSDLGWLAQLPPAVELGQGCQFAVDDPADAKLVNQHTKLLSPKRWAVRHSDCSTFGQRIKD